MFIDNSKDYNSVNFLKNASQLLISQELGEKFISLRLKKKPLICRKFYI